MRLRWLSAALPALLLLTVTPIRPAAASPSPSGHVSGVVEDEAGTPLPATGLRFVDGAGATAAEVAADGHGRYTAALPSGTYRVVVTATEQDRAVSARIAAVDIGETTPLDIVVAGGPSQVRHLTGTVVDPAGDPVPYARVITSGWHLATVADATGRFDLAVQAGTYPLRIEATDGSAASFDSDAFDLTTDRQKRFTLSPPVPPTNPGPNPYPTPVTLTDPVTVSGTVTGADGGPLSGVRVGAAPVDYYSTPYSGPDGHYQFRASIGAGTLNLFWSDGAIDADYCETPAGCQGADYTLAVSNFHPETAPSPLDLRLPPGTFTVRVVDGAGRPVEGADVTADSTAPATSPGGALFPGGPVSGHIHSQYTTGADGQATIPMIPGHAPVVHVDPPSDRGLPADAAPAASAGSTTVTVPGGVMVHGAITDTAGRGAWFRHAGLVSTDGKVSRPFTLGTDRRSYSVMVPAGRYQLVTDITDGEPGGESDDHYAFDVRSAPFTVAADTAVDFTLPADSDTEAISFVGPDGEPVEGDLSLRSTSPDNGVRLAAGIPGTASAAHGVFGSTTGDQVLVFAGGTVGAYFNGGFPLSLSGLPATPGGLIIVAEADGSDLALTEPVQDIVVDQTGPGSIAVRWTPPADDHGSAITGYAVRVIERSDVHEAWLTTPDPGAAISGLTPGTDNLVVVSVMTGRGVGAQNSLSFTLDGGPPAAGPDPDPDQAPAGQPAEPGHTTTASGGAGVSAGYWALGVDGRVYNFGEAPALGNATSGAVDLEPTPTGKGYWVLNRTGTVQAFGDAMELGDADMSKLAHGEQPASLSATPTGKGYWVFTNRGRVLAFGDAPFLGDMAQTRLNGPVLGSVATPSGHGYYLVASDGGIFSFGDAIFAGSMGGRKLNAPVTSLVPDRDGHGYWLVASDGGIFAFDAPFRGSMGGRKLNQPVVGMVRYGDGYLMVGADGGIFDFSTAPFSGSLGDQPPTAPVVAVAALP